MDTLQGDWREDTIHWYCSETGCTGGAECDERAVQKILGVIVPLLFSSKMPVPALSRWWKVAPCVRRCLLGVACHRLFILLQPRDADDEGDGERGRDLADSDLDWRKIHGMRIAKTTEFYSDPHTLMRLFISKTATAASRLPLAPALSDGGSRRATRLRPATRTRGRAEGRGMGHWETCMVHVLCVIKDGPMDEAWAGGRGAGPGPGVLREEGQRSKGKGQSAKIPSVRTQSSRLKAQV